MWKRNTDWLLLICGDWTHNPGMCPHQKSNQRPFALQHDQPNEPHQLGPDFTFEEGTGRDVIKYFYTLIFLIMGTY